jgi:hypothetical protein
MKTPIPRLAAAAVGAVSDRAGLRAAGDRGIDGAAGADQALRKEREQRQAERARLLSAPATTAEQLARAEASIDRAGRAFWSTNLDRVIHESGSVIEALEKFPVVTLDLRALCALCPDQVKAAVRAAVTSRAIAGEPLEGRAERIAAIDQRIGEIEREHRALVDKAAAQGIVIADLDTNRAARVREERQREEVKLFNEVNRRAIQRGAIRAKVYEPK